MSERNRREQKTLDILVDSIITLEGEIEKMTGELEQARWDLDFTRDQSQQQIGLLLDQLQDWQDNNPISEPKALAELSDLIRRWERLTVITATPGHYAAGFAFGWKSAMEASGDE